MDKSTRLEKKLNEIAEAFKAMQKNGVSEKLLISYLQTETKMSRRDIKRMLEATEDFFNELIGKEVADKI
jgi:hypothetical protein